MQFKCDLHIHSKYAYATSKNISIESLIKSAKLQGLNCIGTGDILHSLWYEEIKKYMAENTLDIVLVPTVEICDKHNKHHLIIMQNFKIRDLVREKLKDYGNLDLNGRPFIKLQPFELCKILNIEGVYIGAAHIFSPYTGCLNYYKTIQAIYMQNLKNIIFFECGLDAWIEKVSYISTLKELTGVKFSDCHSSETIGREYICVELDEFSVTALMDKIKKKELKYISSIPALARWYQKGFKNNRFINGVNDLIETIRSKNKFYQVNVQYKIPLKIIIQKLYSKKFVNDIYYKIIEKFHNEHNIFSANINEEKDEKIKFILKIYKNPLANIILKNIGKLGQNGDFQIRSE